MKTNITSRHEKLTSGLREHIEGKIERVERYLGKIKEAHVVLTFEKKVHVCEVTLAAKGLKLSAKAESHDMYQSIDVALMRLTKQAQKHKDIWSDKHKGLGRRSPGKGPEAPFSAPEKRPRILSDDFEAKPMTPEEAALQLSGSREGFLVFLNSETEKASVVYKRKDKNIGLIEP